MSNIKRGLVLLLGVGAIGWGPVCPEAVAQTGAIEGVVTFESQERPRRRTANRGYGGGGAPPVQQIQPLPTLVYLTGSVPGAPAGPASNLRLVQRDTAFVPGAVFVGVGGSIEFPNEDPFYHNVFSYSSAKRFDLGRFPQGESKTVTFDEPGLVNVFCEVHDAMRGAIVVTENPFHAVVEDGGFRLGGIPPGDYTLVIWHPDYETVERTVTILGGQVERIEVELRT